MKEESLTSALLVTGFVQQQLLAVLASKGLIDLTAMHTALTQEVISALQKAPSGGLDLQQIETTSVASLDQLFSSASRIAARLRDQANQDGEVGEAD